MNDFINKKQRIERGISCEDILKSAIEDLKNTKSIVVVSVNNDNEILTSYSLDNSLEALGMLKVVENEILNSFYD